MPGPGVKYTPAISVPTIAPAVFALYNRPMRSPAGCVRKAEDLMTSGSVAPMSVVGTISTPIVIATRATVRSGSEFGASAYTRP